MTHFQSSTILAPQSAVLLDEMGEALCLSIERCRSAFEGQNVLVTGACGFLGGHLVRALHRAGAHVVASDCDTTSSHRLVLEAFGLTKTIRLVETLSEDRRALADVIVHGGFSTIFHLSSAPLPALCAAAQLLPRDKWPLIVHTSQDHSDYPRHIGLQLCHVFGAYDFDFESSTIAGAMRNIFRDGESPELAMNAMEAFQEYVFVEDAVRALLHLADSPVCSGGSYDLPGAYYGATADLLREIVLQVSLLQDEMALVEPRSPLAQHHWNRSIRIVPSKPKEADFSAPRHDGTRLCAEADYEPCTSLREGLQLTAQFYARYFSQLAPQQPGYQTAAPRLQRPAEPAFETTYTDDGLPVYVLNPHAHVRDKGAPRVEERRPRAFVVESALTAVQ